MYAVYVYDKFYKNWRTDRKLHTLKEAKSMVKGLRANSEKAFYARV